MLFGVISLTLLIPQASELLGAWKAAEAQLVWVLHHAPAAAGAVETSIVLLVVVLSLPT